MTLLSFVWTHPGTVITLALFAVSLALALGDAFPRDPPSGRPHGS